MPKWRDIKQGRPAPSNEAQKASTQQQNQATPCASISSRLKAFLTDTFLITTPIFYLVIYFIMGSGEAFAQDRTMGWLLILALHSLVILFFWNKKAQTPGMKAYDIELVTYGNRPVTLVQTLLRYLATLFAVISLFLMLIPFFRKDKRTFQDIFSNSYVIHT